MARSTHHPDYQVFLASLRELRISAGVTQIGLGERLDNTQTFISKVERGERRLDVVEFIEWCEALKADPVAFLQTYLSVLRTTKGTSRKLVRRSDRR